jgi:DNA-directed RNA polymerase subunit RPC12/RpoP
MGSVERQPNAKRSPRAEFSEEQAAGYAWHCLRCGHHWNSQGGEKPLACAYCISAYWDRPRKNRPARRKVVDIPASKPSNDAIRSTVSPAYALLPPPMLRRTT